MAMPIRRVLIANRGEIACRIICAAHDAGLETVAIYSDPDATAPHVADADSAVALGGSTAGETYLAIDKILGAADQTRADAIHPGYGFVSESAEFASACEKAGITFIGPTAESIAVMGRKIEAKRIATDAGVPTLPSVSAVDRTPDLSEIGGLPALIKASSGGGGRGMRVVTDIADLEDALASARREAQSAFGDGAVFVERYLAAPRHIEIQIVGDAHGNVVHLGERECSIQRRHQKIIEEAPSPAVNEHMRDEMGRAAVTLAKRIGYVGAGTVEFLVDGDNFYFLEMNTRIQVEHPVTESVTGVDLVQLQFSIAAGKKLPFDQADVSIRGHSIEARLYAEVPSRDWMPSFGTVERFEQTPDGIPRAGVRYDSGVKSGSIVSTFYDSMLAKVIGAGPTREVAIARLRRALSELRVDGIETNRSYLARVIDSTAFRAAQTTTAFVDEHSDLLDEPPVDPSTLAAHLAAAVVTSAMCRRADSPLHGFAPIGWRNVASQRPSATFDIGDATVVIGYDLSKAPSIEISIDSIDRHGHIYAASDNSVDLEIDGLRRTCAVNRVGNRFFVSSGVDQTTFTERPRFAEHSADSTAGGPTAPVPGQVVDVHVTAGDRVKAGDALVTIEAMKMEHRVEASTDCLVGAVLVAPGDSVEAHEVLVELDEAT